nr:hypothetical protein [Tanacetum cinerariifolium]
AERDLNQAVSTFADRQQVPPTVVVLPKKPHDALISGVLELDVLGNLSDAQKRDLGAEPLTQRRTAVRAKVQSALDALKADVRAAADYIVRQAVTEGLEKLKRDDNRILAALDRGLRQEEANFASLGAVSFLNTTNADWNARVQFVPR